MNRQETLNNTIDTFVSKFKSEHTAPIGMVGVAFNGGCGITMLFNTVKEAHAEFIDMVKDENVVVMLTAHNYAIEMNLDQHIDQNLNPRAKAAAAELIHEAFARAMVAVYHIPLMDWIDVHGTANDKWFEESTKSSKW